MYSWWALILCEWYIQRGNLDPKTCTHQRTTCEEESTNQGDAYTSQGTSKMANKHQKLGNKHGTNSPLQPSEGAKPART